MKDSKQLLDPYQVRAAIFQKYETLIRDGTYKPLTSSSFSWGLFLLFLFLLVPPTSKFHNKATRYLVFSFVLLWHVYLVSNFRARSLAVSFGAGISSAWGTLWAASVLVFKDAKVDSKRVEQREGRQTGVERGQEESGEHPQRSPGRLRKMHDESNLRQRARTSEVSQSGASDTNVSSSINDKGAIQSGPDAGLTYVWQSYPLDTFWHRLRWVADILTNFRGVGWDWRISGLPSLPPQVQASLARSSHLKDDQPEIKDITISHSGLFRHDTVISLVRHNVYLLVIGYFLVDALKTTMNHDAYFFTGDPSTPAPTWLAPTLSVFPPTLAHIILTSYRLLITMSMVWLCLRTIFTLAPLTFSALLSRHHSPLLSTRYLRPLAFFAANGEPWLYPDAFGAYSNVFRRGLAGWWGQWWHSIFRYAFQASGEFAVRLLAIQGKGGLGRAVQVAAAFFVSGCIHASGSVTMVRETKPWSGSFMFFLSQIVGVLAEAQIRGLLKKWVGSSSGKTLTRAGYLLNFVWVHTWFYWTAPLLVNDFARSGLWTFEPLAVSLFRGLGFGVDGDGWWCLGGERVWWHWDEHWWLSGVAF